jgi:acyl-CoA thioester hydrolase
MYKKILQAGWGDMDFNSHMGNTAYLDKTADVRMMFFSEHGFPVSEFARLRLGPVIQKDEIEYFREVNLLDELTITFESAGLSEDGSRFIVRNEFFRADGKLIARVTSTGGWLDLSIRKLVVPPVALLEAMQELHQTDDFQELPTSIK